MSFLELPILESHIPLWENECGIGFQFFDLDQIPKPIWTPEPLLDLSQIPESVLVSALPEYKSIIPSFYTLFWNKGVNKIDSEVILKVLKLDGVKVLIKITNAYIIIMGYIL